MATGGDAFSDRSGGIEGRLSSAYIRSNAEERSASV
jgi:hypothetical protein